MKNKLLRLVLLLGLLSAVLTMSVLAATPGYCSGAVSYNASTGRYTASYHSAVSGNQYVLLVVDRAADGSYPINADTIQYIDQTTASGPNVSFTFIPRSYAAGDTTKSCVVLLTYTGGTQPVVLGELTGNAAGSMLSGTVTMQARTAYGGISVSFSDGATEYTATTDASGGFSFSGVPDGTYTLTFSHASYLTRTKSVTVSGNTNLGSLTLLGGDVNADRYVNANDLSLVLGSFGQHGITAPVDITGDTYVNANDLSAVLSSFGKNSNTGYGN